MLGAQQSGFGQRGEEIFWLYRESNPYSSVVEPVGSRYTDYATAAPVNK
jgi:hypothetical protein